MFSTLGREKRRQRERLRRKRRKTRRREGVLLLRLVGLVRATKTQMRPRDLGAPAARQQTLKRARRTLLMTQK